MNARSVVFEMSPDKVDDAVSQFEDGVIPRFREISGYKGFTLLVNRENGKTLGISFWESEDLDFRSLRRRRVLVVRGRG